LVHEIGLYKSEIAGSKLTCEKRRYCSRATWLVRGHLGYNRLLDRVFPMAGEFQLHSLLLGPCNCYLDLNFVGRLPHTSKILTLERFVYKDHLLDIVWLALGLTLTLGELKYFTLFSKYFMII